MKPFNLEAAKAGAKLVTRDGREVEFFAHFPTVPSSDENIRFAVNGRIFSCDEGGFYCGPFDESNYDLFMAPVTRTVYVNLYPKEYGTTGAWHETEEKARAAVGPVHAIAIAVPVTIDA